MNINLEGVGVIFCDTHIPFHDQRVIREVELFMGELQPDILLYPGDLGDWYGISTFDKNPNRADCLQSDLSSVGAMFKRHRALCPNARMIEEDGNHEDRLRRHLWGKDPALASLDCLTVEGLYKLKESGVEHVPYKDGVLIKICDNGKGIPKTSRKRIFEKFQTVNMGSGIGLGLYICKKVVELHKGEIWVEDADLGGAAFCFSLRK